MILVTGCTGYIGFHICEFLELKKIPYFGIDNFSRSHSKNIINKKKFFKFDIGSKKISLLLKSKKIDTIIHAAAFSFPPESENKKKFISKITYKKLKNLLMNVHVQRLKNLFFYLALTCIVLIQEK